MSVKRLRRASITKGLRHQVRLIGGPFDSHRVMLQAQTYGTLQFRVAGQVGRYNQQNEWVPHEYS